METTELRTAAAFMHAAREIFQRRHSDLSGTQLDLEWSQFCSLMVSGYSPDLSHPTSWTSEWPGGPQVTSSDDTQPLELTRSQDFSSQSAPEPRSHSSNPVLGHDMLATMSTSCRLPSTAAKRHSTGSAKRSCRRPRPTHIPAVIGEYDPEQYLTANGLPANCYLDSTRVSGTAAPSLYRSYSLAGSSTPSTPATALTDASTLSPQMMSHNGSIDLRYNDLSQAVDMFRLNSNASSFSLSGGDSKFVDFQTDYSDNCLNAFAPSHQSDKKYLVTHGLDPSPASTINYSSVSAASAFSSQHSTSSEATVLVKSQSSTGSESDSSTSQSRSYRSRRQEHIRQAEKCRILPKKDPSEKPAQMVRFKSSDGSYQMKAYIPRKEPYQRPQQPRQYCSYCNEHPEGFRGEHELQRHTSRAHPSGIRKFWICEDLSGDGSFLANCRACRDGKRYGADYNAAAHLRRAHFHPRKRGRKPKNEAEKRGGMGGGRDPPMDVLKGRWMREVEEGVVNSAPPVDYSNDAAANVEDQPMEEPADISASIDDQLTAEAEAEADGVSSDEFSHMWPSETFQYNTAADAAEVAPYNFETDGASDSYFSYDVQPPQHAYPPPDLEVFQFEETFQWQ